MSSTAEPKNYVSCPPGSDTDFPDHDLVDGLPAGATEIDVCAKAVAGEGGGDRRVAHGYASYSVMRKGVQIYAATTYKNGKLHGLYEEWGAGGVLKGKYEDGVRTGKWVLSENMSGKMKTRAEATYKRGMLEGPFREYGQCWSSATKKAVLQRVVEGSFSSGSKAGRWTRWASMGDETSSGPLTAIGDGDLVFGGTPSPCRRLEEVTYGRGLRNGKTVEYGFGVARDGSYIFFKKSEHTYRDDVLEGPFTTWQEAAPHLVAETGTYGQGQQCGRHVRYFNGFHPRTRQWQRVGVSSEDLGACPKTASPAAVPKIETDVFARVLAEKAGAGGLDPWDPWK